MTPTPDQSFSLRRAVAYGRLFGTGIKRQMIIYPIVTFVIYTFALVISTNTVGLLLGSLLSSVISFMAYLAPLVFAIGSDPVAEVMFPATKSEKAAMLTVYSLAVIPMLLGLSMLLAVPTARLFSDDISASLLLSGAHMALESPVMAVISNVTALLPMSVCLLSVIVYRHRRVLMPVVWTIVSLLIVSLIAGIIGGIGAFHAGIKDGFDRVDFPSQEEMARHLLDTLMPWMLGYFAIVVIATAIIIVITVRKIRNRQL